MRLVITLISAEFRITIFYSSLDQLTGGLDAFVGQFPALISSVPALYGRVDAVLGGGHALICAPVGSIHAAVEASLSLLATLGRSLQNGPDLIELALDFALHSFEV
jgi:hypothetical protein